MKIFLPRNNVETDIVDTTYSKDDVIFLLSDYTGKMKFTSKTEKEELIRKGINYSEMISYEDPVDTDVNEAFVSLLRKNAEMLAKLTETTVKKVLKEYGNDVVFVSLARAGTPVGVLMKRYCKGILDLEIPHYSISVIRDIGIDENALYYILDRHPGCAPVFIDGWTGKGSINTELKKSVSKFNAKYSKNIKSFLTVLADPAHMAEIYGTRKDICLPNACLNSTVSGLVSRTIHNSTTDSARNTPFHGAVYFEHLINQDYSYMFVDTVAEKFKDREVLEKDLINEETDEGTVENIFCELEKIYPSLDRTQVKLSIGESSRAVIRRIPKIILVKNENNPDLEFIMLYAKKKNIKVINYDTGNYECITIIR